MLNEERVKLMTRMASYEAGEGKKNMNIGKYFRGDYIGIQVLKSIICSTIAFGICFALYLFYDFEHFMQDIYQMDLIQFAKDVLFIYAAVVIGYALVTYIIYSVRYKKARKSLKKYYNNLRKLSGLYE